MSGTLFFPRGGSAFVTRALTRALGERGVDITLLAGSRHDLDGLGDARSFYSGIDLHEVDFTPALSAPDPMAYAGEPGTAPLQPSFEARPGAADRVLASLDETAYEHQVAAWARELRAASAEAADLLVLPSVRESFGQVIVEAMACGVPAVAAASLGPARIINDGETGWLFGVDDRAGLIAALVDAVNHPAERARRARLAQRAALDRFTWAPLAGRLEPILRRAAGWQDGQPVGNIRLPRMRAMPTS